MPNLNYNKGRGKEYREMKRLRFLGYDVVTRSAGSHSPVDVIGINSQAKVIKLIQCKPKSMGEAARERIAQEFKKLNGFYIVEFLVI